MSTTRTDIHRPTTIDPEDYVCVGAFYIGASEGDIIAYRQENLRRLDFIATAAERGQQVFTEGNFEEKGTCDICGARFAHGAYFLHLPTGDIIHTGWDCAEKVEIADAAVGETRRGILAQSKAEATRIKNIEYRATLLLAVPKLAAAFATAAERNTFIADVARRFHSSKPELSEKQVLSVIRSAEKDAEFVARRAAEQAAGSPVVEGKGVVIEGVVVSTKWVDSNYGGSLKFLVRDDRGFKVWGTRPASLDGVFNPYGDEGVVEVPAAEAGARVRFTGNVEASNDDPTFGFVKRPRKGELLAPAPEEAA